MTPSRSTRMVGALSLLLAGCGGPSIRQERWLQPRERFAENVTTVYAGGSGKEWDELADALIARGYLPALEPAAGPARVEFGGWDTTEAEYKNVTRTQDVQVGSITNWNNQTVGRIYERQSYQARVRTADEYSDGAVYARVGDEIAYRMDIRTKERSSSEQHAVALAAKLAAIAALPSRAGPSQGRVAAIRRAHSLLNRAKGYDPADKVDRFSQPDRVIALCEEALALCPEYSEALALKAETLSGGKTKDYEQSLRVAIQAIAVNPAHCDYSGNPYDTAGWCALALGCPEQAINLFGRLLNLHPSVEYVMGRANQGLAFAYCRLGDSSSSDRAFAAAASWAPVFKQGREKDEEVCWTTRRSRTPAEWDAIHASNCPRVKAIMDGTPVAAASAPAVQPSPAQNLKGRKLAWVTLSRSRTGGVRAAISGALKIIFPPEVLARGGLANDVEGLLGAGSVNAEDQATASRVAGALGADIMVLVSEIGEGPRYSRVILQALDAKSGKVVKSESLFGADDEELRAKLKPALGLLLSRL